MVSGSARVTLCVPRGVSNATHHGLPSGFTPSPRSSPPISTSMLATPFARERARDLIDGEALGDGREIDVQAAGLKGALRCSVELYALPSAARPCFIHCFGRGARGLSALGTKSPQVDGGADRGIVGAVRPLRPAQTFGKHAIEAIRQMVPASRRGIVEARDI